MVDIIGGLAGNLQGLVRNTQSLTQSDSFDNTLKNITGQDPSLQQDLQSIRETSRNQLSMQSGLHVGDTSFGDMMKGYINDVNNMQVQADEDVRKAIAGEPIDAHQVMLSVEKANIGFELVMEVRNKLVDAYREIMKSSV